MVHLMARYSPRSHATALVLWTGTDDDATRLWTLFLRLWPPYIRLQRGDS